MRPLTFSRGIWVSSDKGWASWPAAGPLETSSVARISDVTKNVARKNFAILCFIGSPSRLRRSCPFLSDNNSPWRSLRSDLQVVEMRDRVRFCPQPDLACDLERVVGGVDFLAAVVVTSDLIANCFHPELMPFSRRNFEIGSSELAAPAVYHVIQPVIALKSVGAHDVIVVRVFQAEDQPSCSVNASRNGFEFHAEV